MGGATGSTTANRAELIALQRSRRVQERRAARHPARPAAHRERLQRHGTGLRARRHRADGVAEPNLSAIRRLRRLAERGDHRRRGRNAARLREHLRRRQRGFTSSFRRKRPPIGRRWNGWPANSAVQGSKFTIHKFTRLRRRRRVYRFFELFDLANVPNCERAFSNSPPQKRIRLTPPPKPIFEEKMLFALLWNRNLHDFWRQELGEGFFTPAAQARSLHLGR